MSAVIFGLQVVTLVCVTLMYNARYMVSMHSGEYPNNGPGIVLVPVAGDHGKQSWLAYNGTPCANGNTHT